MIDLYLLNYQTLIKDEKICEIRLAGMPDLHQFLPKLEFH
jgi:hypothetical protein